MSNQAVSDPLLALDSLSSHFQSAFELGVALEPATLVAHGPVVAHHFRRLTAENAMKWEQLCPTEGCYTWDRADAIANFARRHGMRMTGHTLLWHQMQPRWLFLDAGALIDRATLAERLRDHIFCTVERYADVVDNWDVVNEAISDRPGEMWRDASGHSKWYEVFGNEDFVELAFRYATEAVDRFAPKTQLYYNDYDIELADKRGKVLDMVRALRSKGVRIDGVGIQGHINLNWPTKSELGLAIDEFAALELRVKVSELDISVYTEDDKDRKIYQEAMPVSAELDEVLARRYLDVFEVLVSRSRALTSVVLWGLDDATTWLNHFPLRRPNHPLLIDREGQPKLAMKRLLAAQVGGDSKEQQR